MAGLKERVVAGDRSDAVVTRGWRGVLKAKIWHARVKLALALARFLAPFSEGVLVHGTFHAECVGPDGRVKWSDVAHNTVVTLGKNILLDTLLGGSAYTVTGPFMGLVGDGSFSAIAAADTMASHAGWQEAGGTHQPTYSGNRKTIAFSAASSGSKAATAAAAFAMTNSSGTVKGCFLVLGTGAVNTKDDTNGTLYSAGLFAGGDKTTSSGDTLNVTYTASA